MGTYQKVAETKDVPQGRGVECDLLGQGVAIFNVDGTYCAIGGTCTHQGGPLSEGALDGFTVTCPWHGAQFDVRTGERLSPPAPTGVPRYKVRVEGTGSQFE